MWCPKCRNEYRDGIFECKSCGVKLVENEPVDMLELCTYTDSELPERVKEFLIDSDIKPIEIEENEDETFSLYVPKTMEKKSIKVFNAFMEMYEEELLERQASQEKYSQEKKSQEKYSQEKKSQENNSAEYNKESDSSQPDEDEDDYDYDENASYDWDAEDKKELEDIINEADFEEKATHFSSDENDDPSSVVYSSSTKYVTEEEKYNDYKFSGITFIIFGIIGGTYLTLTKLEIIPINYNNIVFGFICAIFAAFIIYGIRSLLKAAEVKVLIPEEQERTRVINEWLKLNVTSDIIDSWANEDVTEAENDLLVMAHIREALVREYPDYDPGYLDMLAEKYYEEFQEEE